MAAVLFDSSRGLVEYSYTGNGPVILLLKGGYSSRSTDLSHSSLIYEGYSLLTISRPGYDRTETSAGRSSEEFADTIVEILDHLNIDQVDVIAISAAGPTGIALSVRHSDRVRKLILEAALTSPLHFPLQQRKNWVSGNLDRFIWKSRRWLLRLSPNFAMKQVLKSLTTESAEDYMKSLTPNDRRFINEMIRTSQAGKGLLIDREHRVPELSQVKAPVLGMYAQKDKSISYSNALLLQSNVPECEIYDVPSNSHLIWIGKQAPHVWNKRLEFLNR
ncbi:alpha/beta fold hydrolase [Halobacillus sp. Marseille-Q1614]|uniref:alpha/beta fold hydrolase n=1 Tax=Halobacillus sp. Marseille-Q1614 TaxID=2709134 RepID=UPI001571161A|nr:alpha/beta hydrolase [Halobacillus sp. Marseille-Q1614]